MTEPVDDRTGRPSRPACAAPFASLHLDPTGQVRACCQNSWHPLGSVRTDSLRAMWHGRPAQDLRAALGAGSFHLGCEMCGVMVRQGSSESAHLSTFERFDVTDPDPEWPAQLELALSNACNLQCVMCNGDLSSAIRIHREHRPPLETVYGDDFFDELRAFIPHLRYVTFLGGEPFLSPEAGRVMDLIAELNPAISCHVTTNGTQINARIERFVSNHRCHVAVSVDGSTAATNEAIRLGTRHDDVVRNLHRFIELTSASGAGTSLAFTLMRTNVHEFGELLAWADGLGLDVFVNRVLNPPAMSLFHLPIDELRPVVHELEHESEGRRRELTRNREVWERELDALRHHLDEARHDPATPTSVTIRRAAATAPDAVVRIGADQVVQEVTTSDGWALGDPAALIGANPVAILHFLSDRLGTLTTTDLEFVDGVEVRTLRFSDGGRTHEVTASLHTEADGVHRWEIRTRRPPVDQVG